MWMWVDYALSLLGFVSLVAFLTLGSLLILYHWFPLTRLVDRILALVVIAWSQIVLITIAFGVLNRLSFLNLWITQAVLLGVLLAVSKRAFRNSLRQDLASMRAAMRVIVQDQSLLLTASLVASPFGLLTSLNLITPPISWDSLTYHLTFPVEWIRRGNLDLIPTLFGDSSPTYYPFNAEFTYLWWLFPFRSAIIADLGQVPFWLTAMLALYAIGRKLSLSKRIAWKGAVLFSVTPGYMIGLLWADNDIVLAAAYLLALNFLLLLWEAGGPPQLYSSLVLSGSAFGLLIGTKSLALLYSLPLALPIVAMLLSRLYRGGAIDVVIVRGGLWLFSAFLTGGGAYIRNLVLFRNPFYPMRVQILNVTLFEGYKDIASYKAHPFYNFSIPERFYDIKFFPQWWFLTLGILAALVILPVLGANIGFIWKRGYVHLFLPVVTFCIFYYLSPIRHSRFLHPITALGCLAATFVIELFIQRMSATHWSDISRYVGYGFFLMMLGSLLGIAVGIVDVTGTTFLRPIATPSIFLPEAVSRLWRQDSRGAVYAYFVLVIVGGLAIYQIVNWLIRRRGFLNCSKERAVFVGVVIITLLGFGGVGFQKMYYDREYRGYRQYYDGQIGLGWEWLNAQTQKGDVVAYVGSNVPLPLYGTRLKARPVFVSISAGSVYSRELPNYEIWLDNLEAEHVTYIFITSNLVPTPVFEIEDQWASQHPETFGLIYDLPRVHIYLFNTHSERQESS